MPTTIERIKTLKEAYEWEQARLQTWQNDALNMRGTDTPIIQAFIDIWEEYFNEIMESNKAVIKICNDAIDAPLSEATAASDTADNDINEETHRKSILENVKDGTRAARIESEGRPRPKPKYFQVLDNTIALELRARNKIQNFLRNGTP